MSIHAMAIALWLVFFSAGCASTSIVQEQVAFEMRRDNYSGALSLVEQEKSRAFGSSNRLLYFLEKGMLLHVMGDFEESNAAFESAKRLGRRLYTKSVSQIGFSIFANDFALDYAGENFERTLVHLFSALNYAALGESDSALVEVRQVGEYLRKLQVDTENGNIYQEDAFARYLSALLYEESGELDAAFVDYKKAVSAYEQYRHDYRVQRPASLLPNAERVAARQGLSKGAAERARFLPRGAGEVVILHYNGLAPVKRENRFLIPIVEAWPLVLAMQASASPEDRREMNDGIAAFSVLRGVDFVPVVFPEYASRPYSIRRMQPYSKDAIDVIPPELVEDIGAIAEKDLEDRMGRVRGKAIARAAIKFGLQKAAELALREAAKDDEQAELFMLATQLTGNFARLASEKADTRTWSTLPDTIWMSTLVLPAGRHEIEVDFLNARKSVVETQVLSGVEVLEGRRKFMIVRTVQ